MVVNIKVNGKIIIWRAWVYILGLMDARMKDSMLTIRNRGMEFILGSIQDSIRDTGIRASNMDWEFIWLKDKK